MNDTGRPSCYPAVPAQAWLGAPSAPRLPLLDVLTSPVPSGRFDSPVDHRHVLCLHLGAVIALFATLPYGKFAHGIFRTAALLRHNAEKRLPSPIGVGAD